MADELNDGTGATAAPDTGGTNPQAAPDTQQIDPKGASDNGTPPESPAQTAQQFPFPGQDASQTPQNAPQGASDLSKSVEGIPNTPPPPAVQQAIQQGGWTHQVLTALAGGPQTQTTIDPNTGKVQRSVVPVSNARLGMSVALAALTGAFNGLAQKGPGAEGRAAAGGFDAALQQKQQQQQQEDKEASQTYARQAAIAATNFTMHQTAQRMGKLDYEDHKEFVADATPVLNNVKAVGADLASGVHEGDLLTKYNITKDAAIPDGVAPRMDPNTGEQAKDKYGQPLWDNTYTVLDPTKKIALDQSTAQFLADHHVPGYFTQDANGKTVPKDFSGSAQVKAGLVVNGLAQASAIKTTEAQLNAQLAKIPGNEGKVDGTVFKANLTQGLQDGTISPKSLQTFAKYASMPFDLAIDQMRKDKVDPQTIGQINSLIPPSATKALTKQRLDEESADKGARDTANAVSKQQAELPGQIQKAQLEKQIDAKFSYQSAFNSEAGRLGAKAKFGNEDAQKMREMVNNPKLATGITVDPNDQPVNGARLGVLKQFGDIDPGLAAEIKAIGEGRQVLSKYGLAKGDGQKLSAFVQLAYPSYDSSKAEAYDKMRDQYTTGNGTAKQIQNGNTTFQHFARLYDNAGKVAALIPGTRAHSDFVTDSGRAIDEMNGAYNPGVLHKDDRARLEDNANSVLPDNRQEFARESMRLLVDKVHQTQEQWRRGKPSNAVSDFPLLSQDAVDSYNHVLHGESAVDEYGKVTPVAGKMKDKQGNSYFVDAKRNALYPVNDTY